MSQLVNTVIGTFSQVSLQGPFISRESAYHYIIILFMTIIQGALMHLSQTSKSATTLNNYSVY